MTTAGTAGEADMSLDFTGRVAIVTGAGLGLGRSYALELARRGAKVLVNDLGRESREGAPDVSRAGLVADAITAAGGEADASEDSVEDGARIVEQAMDRFGRVDVLINNAGVLRNTSFVKMSEEDWDLLYRVHLLGTMRVTKAVWPHMREARYGRVLVTSSNAGYFGSVGAANYAAMKAGSIALAQTLALEGASRDVKVNVVAPMAGSQLTAGIWPQRVMEAFTPDLVARAVMLLVHERCRVSGRVFEVGGGWMSELRWQQSEGVLLDPDFTAEAVEANWNAITRFPADSGGERANDYLARIEKVTGERVKF